MLNVWDEQGPPVHISVAAYLGLTKGSKGKKGKPGKFDPSNPFGRRPKPDATPTPGERPAPVGDTGDLDELVRMFRGTGGVF